MDIGFDQGNSKQARHIDGFLTKNPKTNKRLTEMVAQTTELPLRQNLLFNLMNLTNDVRTFSSDLITHLAEDDDLVNRIIEKAKVSAGSSVTASQLKLSVQKLGYGLVHNEVQESLAREYVKIYYKSESQDLKTLIKKSIRLAFTAKELSRILHLNTSTYSFFAGINYNIAEMVLALREPRTYEEYKKMLAKGVDHKTVEMAVLGFDLADLSVKTLHKFRLPVELIDVIKNKNTMSEIKSKNYKQAILLQFALFVTTMLDNKKTSPQAMWARAHDYLLKLDIQMKSEDWIEEIKLLYIRLLELEFRLFKR